MYKLVIVESPAKAKTIEKYLGEGYKVVASYGHIFNLPAKSLGVDLETFDLEMEPIEGKDGRIDDLKKMIRGASEIFLASDPDREGEAISFHLSTLIKGKPFHRVLFNAITKNEIIKAINNPLKLNEAMYKSQKARRGLDRLVGYTISPILWRKLGGRLSAGRVQSVALRIIVEREDKIRNFKPEAWFEISAILEKNDNKFKSIFFGKKEAIEFKTKEEAEKVLKEVMDKKFIVNFLDKKLVNRNPTPPFTTSKLQQEASSKLRFNSKKTMEVAQKLYEKGLITYMRTDSVRTEKDALENLIKYIEASLGKDMLPSKPHEYKKKGGGKVQGAHEAIRPTNLDQKPGNNSLFGDEKALYELIWKKFVSSQMASAVFEKTTVFFDVGDYVFKSNGSVPKFLGFLSLYEDKDENDEEGLLPELIEKEELAPIEGPTLEEKYTKPPPRFNEAGLVKELESKGIGRPSTYASIIANISDRLYVKKEKDRFLPTDLGESLCRFLIQYFPKEMDISFTAAVEDQLDQIEEGSIEFIEVMKAFWQDLKTTTSEVKKKIPDVKREYKTTGIKCQLCETGEYAIKKTKDGEEILGCSNYPDCKSVKNFKKNKKGEIEFVEKKREEGKACPICSKRTFLIKTKNVKFFSCEDYPKCKGTRPFPTKFKCEKCDGFLVEKRSKKGLAFWGCENFPSCNYVLFDKPLSKKCETCSNYLVQKSPKEGKKYNFCLKCKKKA